MLKTDKGRTSVALRMKAVIISDDLAFAAKARAILRRVGRQPDLNVQWTLKCWQAEALNETALAQTALTESLDAHLVALPRRCACSPSSWLLDWLEQWMTQRRISDAALGVINDATSADGRNSLCPELSRIISHHKLKLILDESRVANDESKPFVHFSREREVLLPLQRTRLAAWALPDAFLGWDIND